MIALAAEDLADLRRWMISAAIVVLAHGSIAGGMVRWRNAIEPADSGDVAVAIDFAPVPVAPAMQPSNIAPGPKQEMTEAEPEQKVEQQPVEEPPPDVMPAPNPDLAVEPPREARQEVTRQSNVTVPETAPQQFIPPQTAAVAAAPIPAWKTQIVALLEHHKRYPPAAQSRHQQGTAQVFFSIDREGRVLDSRIVRSAGVAALDAEALALLKRAQPFPPPPPELAGERITVTVPIAFQLK
jgi:periplasmic protein TonB